MHAAMLREIWRRVKAKKELEEKVRLQAVAEAAAVVELKQHNEEQEAKLVEMQATIEKLEQEHKEKQEEREKEAELQIEELKAEQERLVTSE